jgi:hypothetical protein
MGVLCLAHEVDPALRNPKQGCGSWVRMQGVASRAGLLSARLATTQQTNSNGASLFCLMRQAGLALELYLAKNRAEGSPAPESFTKDEITRYSLTARS